MLKSIIKKEEWEKISPVYKREGVQYYTLRIDPIENDDYIISLEEVFNHMPTESDEDNLRRRYLTICKNVMIKNAIEYANTPEIQSFNIGNQVGWLKGDKRVLILRAFNAEKEEGRTETHLFINNVDYVMPIEKGIEILNKLEVYAKDCNTVTESHIAAINSCDKWYDVEDYDYKVNYPEKISFEE